MLTNGKKYPGMTAPENINDIVQIQPDEVLAVFTCKMKQERLKQTFNQCGVNYESIATDEDFVKALMNLFRRRA